MGGVSLPVECLDGQAYEPLTVHPWLAVVAITMIPISKRTTNARWARSRGKRILNIYSGRILAGGGRSVPSLEYYRVGSISQPARASTVPNPV